MAAQGYREDLSTCLVELSELVDSREVGADSYRHIKSCLKFSSGPVWKVHDGLRNMLSQSYRVPIDLGIALHQYRVHTSGDYSHFTCGGQ